MASTLKKTRTPRCVAALLLALVGLLFEGCGAHTRLVPAGPQPEDAPYVRVSEPPPHTRVEILPLARHSGCAWLDGHFERRGSSWQWEKGAWVRPPKGCFYAHPTTRYEQTSTGVVLVHHPGAWYPKNPANPCAVVAPCDQPTAATPNQSP